MPRARSKRRSSQHRAAGSFPGGSRIYISQPHDAGSKPAENQPQPSHTPPRPRRSSQMSAKSYPAREAVLFVCVSWGSRATGKRGRAACRTCRGRLAEIRAAAQEGGGGVVEFGHVAEAHSLWGSYKNLARAAMGGLLRGRTDSWALECIGRQARGPPNSAPPFSPPWGSRQGKRHCAARQNLVLGAANSKN